MRYKVHLLSEAETDIEEAASWYEIQREGLGGEFLDEVQSVFSAISDNPVLHAIIHRHTRRALLRRFPFAVYYRIDKKSLAVIAVMHGSRHPKRWRTRT